MRVGDDRVEASTVVVATGSETTTMLERLGWEIPMDPSPGLLAVTKPTDPFLEGTVYVYPQSGLSVHLRQMSDGRVLMGERAQDEVAKNPTLEHAQSLLRQAQRSFPALETTQVDHFTVEWRPDASRRHADRRSIAGSSFPVHSDRPWRSDYRAGSGSIHHPRDRARNGSRAPEAISALSLLDSHS